MADELKLVGLIVAIITTLVVVDAARTHRHSKRTSITQTNVVFESNTFGGPFTIWTNKSN